MSSRHGLELRAATPADAPAVAELLALCGRAVPAPALAARLAAAGAASGCVLIALEWGPPSGIVTAHWHPTLLADQPAAAVSLLLVAPEARGRGIARLLLKAAAQAARSAGCDTLTLAVSAEQADLRGFCTASGFEAAGEVWARGLRKKVAATQTTLRKPSTTAR